MKILLDTHIMVWALCNQGMLPEVARSLMQDAGNELLFSPVSVKEIAHKHAIHPEELTMSGEMARDGFIRAGYVELPFSAEHAAVADTMPMHHRDPFDRMLLAQAKSEGIKLLSHDKRFPAYGDFVIPV